jgi:hypothetical protein
MNHKAEHYTKYGWLKIRSRVLYRDFYLVANDKVEVPNKRLLRINQGELEALKGLPPDEIRLMFSAKEIFKGQISKSNQVDKKGLSFSRKDSPAKNFRKPIQQRKMHEERQEPLRF